MCATDGIGTALQAWQMAHRDLRDQAVANLSRRQFGIISRAQLLGTGFTDSSIRRAVLRADLLPVLPKVYRVASGPVTLRQRQVAAVLWAGPGAALCNSTAAQALGLLDGSLSHIEVVTQRRPIARPGFVAHRRRELAENRFPLSRDSSSLAARRTLLDLCASTIKSQAEIALDAALRLELVSFEELRAMLGYATEHRLAGAALFREMLSVRGEEEAMSESELESVLVRVMRRAALPSPIRQVIVDWHECHRLDFVFPDHGLIVEVDGRKWHASRQRFTIDRRRDNAATLRGMRVLRLTWEDVTTTSRTWSTPWAEPSASFPCS